MLSLFFYRFIFNYVFVYACVSVCGDVLSAAIHEGQKRLSDSLGLELQVLMDHTMLVLGREVGSSGRAASPLDTEPSLWSLYL